jgi:hypothetical protein
MHFMTFTTACRHCKKSIEFLDVQAGTKLHCPRCSRPLILRANASSRLKWLLIPLGMLGAIAGVAVLLFLVEPGFQDSVKDSWGVVKRFFGPASGPPKR